MGCRLDAFIVSFLGFLPMFLLVLILSFYKIHQGKKENNKNEMANGYIGLLIFTFGVIVSVIYLETII